jgi:hypothetical protein
MVDLRTAAELYSFRNVERVVTAGTSGGSPSAAGLAAIEAKLNSANALFAARRHQEALRDYRATGSLVFRQLMPSGPRVGIKLPIDPQLFENLLSMWVEWLNVLPIIQPASGLAPRDPVDPVALAIEAKYEQVGLRSTDITAAGAGAIADLQTAQALETVGNVQAAEFYLARAREDAAGRPSSRSLPVAPVPESPAPYTSAGSGARSSPVRSTEPSLGPPSVSRLASPAAREPSTRSSPRCGRAHSWVS